MVGKAHIQTFSSVYLIVLCTSVVCPLDTQHSTVYTQLNWYLVTVSAVASGVGHSAQNFVSGEILLSSKN